MRKIAAHFAELLEDDRCFAYLKEKRGNTKLISEWLNNLSKYWSARYFDWNFGLRDDILLNLVQ